MALCGMDTAHAGQYKQHIDITQWRDSFGTGATQVYFTDGNALFNPPSQRRLDSLALLAKACTPNTSRRRH